LKYRKLSVKGTGPERNFQPISYFSLINRVGDAARGDLEKGDTVIQNQNRNYSLQDNFYSDINKRK